MFTIKTPIVIGLLIASSMTYANDECIKPQVADAIQVTCLTTSNIVIATLDGALWALVDAKGDALTDYTFDRMRSINDDLIAVAHADKVGAITTQGKQVLPMIYDNLQFYPNQYFRLRQGDKYGVADASGKVVLPVAYDWIDSLDDDQNRVLMAKQQKKGLIDNEGNIILPAKYDRLFCCNNPSSG
ncbi:WG repeat-containing protein [Psychrobacter sp.]|uniref:WG repeat-containing protein n=1 Tax=unclassified Psychrobacter TaxID=196806 RepID=UPI003F9E0094